ncbi:MAG: Mg2+-importing ATPase [Parcubacteria group bacterium Gr01-1014_18]|nr:MAG: Mg2+-importing ATPase [Parcubacteria group bacterium Greene0416_36]TSC80288.1 MAG: Mg2+-importing ATPase [Parcubacteria group bacterium Gr01-1014_18]TSC98267.1 MAG: Mg2+-importing ATPase [Parcubacteria group bacterium Greene1014_20]TSD06990.1 MAG: Mg2+-importing ATPase [Parcubacteria group bacterium Greene0714_2]
MSLLYSSKSIRDIFSEFKTKKEGLSQSQVFSRQKKYGLNELQQKSGSGWKILFRQMKSPFLYLLAAASCFSFFLGESVDGWIIILFIAINIFFGFFQEYRSEKILRSLSRYLVSRTVAVRGDREITISSTEIVPGDIVIFEAGSIVSADARLLEANDFWVDESVLSGESSPAEKQVKKLKSISSLDRASNMVFSGSKVTRGRALCVVVATGPETEMGKIGKLVGVEKGQSSFEKGMGEFSRFILMLVLGTVIVLFSLHWIWKGESFVWLDQLLFLVALTVSVIPEALPVVTTFALSRGASRMAEKKVLVKRLSAVEDLGSMEVLCTDKTGTLTQNHLRIADVESADPERALFLASLAADFGEAGASQDPFDRALEEYLNPKQKSLRGQYERLAKYPFDPEHRYNRVLVAKEGDFLWITRGAPEKIMELCGLSSAERSQIMSRVDQMGQKGQRVLAAASYPTRSADPKEEPVRGWIWRGLVGFEDPIKDTAQYAVDKARALGIRLKILTGDSASVSGYVAHRLGLAKSPQDVVTGDQWEAMNLSQRETALGEYSVFARFAPSQKHQVIVLLEKKYEVGYLGDGVNDAPALHAANVSLVVEGGSDVAKETADIILLDKSLASLIDGIEEGRKIFINIFKYLVATLGSNFGNFYAVSVASLLVDFLPMKPSQILLVNLLSDFPMIAIAGDNVDPREIRKPKRYDVRGTVLLGTVLGVVSSLFDFLVFAIFYRMGPGVLQTNWFISSIITELLFIFSVRSKRFFLRGSFPASALLVLSSLAFIATLVIPFTAFGQTWFGFHEPQIIHVVLVLVLGLVYFASTEVVKLAFYRMGGHRR